METDSNTPRLEFVSEGHVSIADTITLGNSKVGERRWVPILGGRFEGPGFSGEVLPGVDWQIMRPDGVLELDAQYAIRATDGTLIKVRNRAIVYIPPGATSINDVYVRSVPEFEAPRESPLAWLNRTIFVGTAGLDGKTVIIRVFKVC